MPTKKRTAKAKAAASRGGSGGNSGAEKDLTDLAEKYGHTKQYRFVLTEDWKKENGIMLPVGTELDLTEDEVRDRKIPAIKTG
ncbi:MAG: hypothetical protein AAGI37_06900 [Planctomycetota bacterium]